VTPSDLRAGDIIRFTGTSSDGTARTYRATVKASSLAPGGLAMMVWRGHRHLCFLRREYDGRINGIEILKRKAA
jgi:hypothetical protein